MGLQGSKPIPALNNNGADNKSLENPKEHLPEQEGSCRAGRDQWEMQWHN